MGSATDAPTSDGDGGKTPGNRNVGVCGAGAELRLDSEKAGGGNGALYDRCFRIVALMPDIFLLCKPMVLSFSRKNI